MKILVRISASTDYDVYPLFMVKCDGLNERILGISTFE